MVSQAKPRTVQYRQGIALLSGGLRFARTPSGWRRVRSRAIHAVRARFKPLLLVESTSKRARECAGAWCHGYLAGVLVGESDWEPFLGREPIENGLSLFAIGSEDFPKSGALDATKAANLHDRITDAAIGIHRFFLEHRAQR